MNTLVATLFLAIPLLVLAVVLIAVKQIFFGKGEFRPGHAHDLPRLRRRALERLNSKKYNNLSNQ